MDYEEAILERYDELCSEFEDEHGRQPTQAEGLKLYEKAQSATDDALCSRGDALRKEAMGE